MKEFGEVKELSHGVSYEGGQGAGTNLTSHWMKHLDRYKDDKVVGFLNSI